MADVFQVLVVFEFVHSVVTKYFDVSEECTVPIFRVAKLVLSVRFDQFRYVGIFNHYTVQKFQKDPRSENSCYVLYSNITT